MLRSILIVLFFITQNLLTSQSQCEKLAPSQLEKQQLNIYQIADTTLSALVDCNQHKILNQQVLASNSTLNNHWYFFRLQGKLPDSIDFLLELDNSQTDHVDIYSRNNKIWQPLLIAGDKVAFVDRNVDHRNILLPLPKFHGSKDFFINVRNRGSYSIPVKLFEEAQFLKYDNNRNLLIGMYLGVVLIFILFVVGTLILSNYDPIHLFYLLYLVSTGMFFLCELGYGDKYIWPHHPNWEEPLIFLIILSSTASFLMLVYHLFKLQTAPAWVRRICYTIMAMMSIAFLSVMTGVIQYNSYFTIFYYLILVITAGTFIFSLVAGMNAISRKVKWAQYIILAFIMMIAGAVVKPAALLGIIPYSGYVHYGGMLGQTIEIVSLSILLTFQYFYNIRYSSQLETQVLQLERSALQAQMNPHFIFNSLNSIQNYIAKNDKMKAMNYLAKFALLVRKTLNASASKKISLEDELSMLKSYLDLEKLRFKEKFSFQLRVDDGIEKETIMLPPLMIQPFVENAIIHGLKNLNDGGEIDIHFSHQNDLLSVSIIDNGCGLDNSYTSNHKSMAMDITRQRLAYVNQSGNAQDLTVENRLDNEGKVIGTMVNIVIKTE